MTNIFTNLVYGWAWWMNITLEQSLLMLAVLSFLTGIVFTLLVESIADSLEIANARKQGVDEIISEIKQNAEILNNAESEKVLIATFIDNTVDENLPVNSEENLPVDLEEIFPVNSEEQRAKLKDLLTAIQNKNTQSVASKPLITSQTRGFGKQKPVKRRLKGTGYIFEDLQNSQDS